MSIFSVDRTTLEVEVFGLVKRGKMKVNVLVLNLLVVALFAGCAAKSLLPGAESVFLSNEKPAGDCVFLSEVVGGQGNWWTDDITSTKALVEGSRNDMKNEAFKLNANYVHVQHTAQDTSVLGGGKIGMSGNAYRCSSIDDR